MEELRPILPIVIVAVLVIVGLALVVRAAHRRIPPAPYRRAAALFSPAELQFLAALDAALGDSYRIFGKVRVADLAEVLPGLNPSQRQAALNRVAYKHFDFVVCSPTCDPLCAVELNDKSHSSSRARRRDAFLAKVCEAIGLPLVTFPTARGYDATQLKERVAAAIAVIGAK
jgi:hypothetical protein